MDRLALEWLVRFMLGMNPSWDELRGLVYDDRSPSERRNLVWYHVRK